MPDNHEKSNNSWRDDPMVKRWLTTFSETTTTPNPLDPDQIILNGSTANLPENLSEGTFRRAFIRVMRQGVATDADGQPHFFNPQTFLRNTNQRVFRSKVDFKDFAFGLSGIVQAKNSSQNKENPAVQQAARAAMDEYLEPELLVGNFSLESELIEIYALLDPEAMKDPMLNQCLIDADSRRTDLAERRRKAAYQLAEDEYLEQKEREREDYDRAEALRLLQYAPNDTPVAQVHNLLKKSPNRVAFERINALKLWRDYIEEKIPDANLTECVRSFQPEPRAPGAPNYPDSDTYSVIAFDYDGHRCMIAECCNDQGQSSGAMKVWRGELDDPNGWEQAFTQTKKSASDNNLCKDIRHTNLTPEVASRNTDNYQHIVDSEDKLFQIAFHYFKTDELLRNDEDASAKLDELAGAEFRRPNPAA